MITICLIDKTGRQDVCNALPVFASLLSVQVNGEFKRAWDIDDVHFKVSNEQLPGEWPCYFVATLDDPQALAYHDEELTGVPGLYVGVDVILNNGGTLKDGSNSLLAAASHEVLEALADPPCIWSTRALRSLTQSNITRYVCLEVADPVEGDAYQVSDGTNIGSVSNFVYRSWFEDRIAPKYDHLSLLDAPQTLRPAGYVQFDDGTQIFGDKASPATQAYKAAHGRRSRAFARHARRAANRLTTEAADNDLAEQQEQRCAL